MVRHVTRRTRTLFRKLPLKSHFWLQSDTLASTQAHQKFNESGYFGGMNANGTAVVTAVARSAPVIRMPPAFIGQTHVNS